MVARLVRDQEVVGSSPVTSTTKRRTVLTVRLFVFVRIVLNPRPLPKRRAPENRSEVFIFNKKSFFSRKIAGAGAEIFVNQRQSQVLIEPCLSRHGAKQGAGEAAGKRSDRAPGQALRKSAMRTNERGERRGFKSRHLDQDNFIHSLYERFP